ncbi:ankyrin [Russula earlei]|uniref:Ankyrin n=1 Tax=Russula earlei TaxID=71964 RepID=A0ACC0TXA4_9AGAM|nr:ankyrin [Russula earlei]
MTTETRRTVSELPPETLDFAQRMFDAARGGNAELLLAAVDAGLPPNLSNEKGNTLLMLAAYAGHAELVRGLLGRGADPNRLNDRGQSPISGAVFKHEDNVVRVLMEGGADPRAGMPNAIATAQMFHRTELFGVLGVCEDEGTFEGAA